VKLFLREEVHIYNLYLYRGHYLDILWANFFSGEKR
jgi:hypothetical protein